MSTQNATKPLPVFAFTNYKDFVNSRLSRGALTKIAAQLNCGVPLLSQIFSGEKDLTPEQALSLCEYLTLDEIETDYIVTMVLKERAGTQKLKSHYSKKLKKIKDHHSQIKSRVDKMDAVKIISPEHQTRYYSDLIYSAVRVCSSIESVQSIEQIATKLKTDVTVVQDAVNFLVEAGVCTIKNNHVRPGPTMTYLSKESVNLISHHRNWRIKALQNLTNNADYRVTAPISVSKEEFDEIKLEITNFVESFAKKVSGSSEPPTEIACLTIDFLRI